MIEEIEESSPFSEKNISAPISLKDVLFCSNEQQAEEFLIAIEGAAELFKTCEIVGVTYPNKTENPST